MKKLFIISVFFILVFTVQSNAQILVSTSNLTGVKLPVNTYRETNTTTLTKTVQRMDSLVSIYNIIIDKQYPELLYVNADSLFNVLKKFGFTVKNVSNPNLFEISKSTYRFMAYKNNTLSFSSSAICLARRK
jgi:hypothetical protein